jgi:hypothetical protein
MGAICNKMADNAAINMHEQWWADIIDAGTGGPNGKGQECFTQQAFERLLHPGPDFGDVGFICCPKTNLLFIIPRCEDHNGWIDKAWITNTTFLTPIAAAVEPAFSMQQWEPALREWYKRCPADGE